MNIVEHKYSFASGLVKRKSTTDIILHHAAALKCSANDIHSWHLQNGWAGIGYHFLVRKDGSVHRGRPIDTVGAHAGNHNSYSIGVCFEGNFETEKMGEAQKEAGAELVTYLRELFPSIKTVGKHKDYNSTACPGKNFPFDYISKGKKTETPTKTGNTVSGDLYRVKNEVILTDPAKVKTTGNGIFTIVEQKTVNGVVFGRLKSGVGWVQLTHAEKM